MPLLWTELCSPPPKLVAILTSNMTVFGDSRAYKEVTKVKRGYKGRTLIQ